MALRLAIRGYIGCAKVFEEFPVVDPDGDDGVEALAEKHAAALLGLPGGDKHMIEIEFLDEANPLERFFRFGTDPALMLGARWGRLAMKTEIVGAKAGGAV